MIITSGHRTVVPTHAAMKRVRNFLTELWGGETVCRT